MWLVTRGNAWDWRTQQTDAARTVATCGSGPVLLLQYTGLWSGLPSTSTSYSTDDCCPLPAIRVRPSVVTSGVKSGRPCWRQLTGMRALTYTTVS